MLSIGDYVLLMPEDDRTLEEVAYGVVVELTASQAHITGVPDRSRRWSIPTETATRCTTTAAEATGSRPGLWLRQPVAAHLSLGWVHGQVVGHTPASVRLRHGGGMAECSPQDLIKTDPIVALLLWDAVLPRRHRATKIRQLHGQLLDQLLGATGRRLTKPSRDIATILDRIVAAEEVPAADTTRSWVELSSGAVLAFPLQHAVDFVYVSESNARRIPRAVRNGIGVSFCRPPATEPCAGAATPTGPEVSSPDSFFDAEIGSSASMAAPSAPPPALVAPATPAPETHNDQEGNHARIVRALASQPELLLAYLDGLGSTTEPPQKRRRRDETYDNPEPDQPSKYAFRPSPRQVAVHKLIVAPTYAGTSAAIYIDGQISHSAVQFAPHPGVLIRLYDFQFGTRGLSIMHFSFMDRLSKLTWIKTSKTNMQNFSHSVALPEATSPTTRDDIAAALGTLHTYCAVFLKPEAGDLIRSLHTFVQHELTTGWSAEDLQHFVFWIDGVLESFREAVVNDIAGGGTSRREIQATVGRGNPDYQATVQLLTQRRLLELTRASAPPQPASRQGHRDRVIESIETGRRRQTQSRYRPAGRDTASYLQHVPRQGNLELCLRSLSRTGCVGVKGAPSQCVYSHRCHFTPAALHADVRAYIDQRLGGLGPDFQHL